MATIEVDAFSLERHLPQAIGHKPRRRVDDLVAEALAVAADSVSSGLDTRIEKPEISLREFVREAWHVVEPGRTFLDNWHIGAICEHLEAVTAGEIRKLLINIPPRHMKSLLVAVLWLPWEWTAMPHTRWLFTSHTERLSKRDSLKTRRIIQSHWYQSQWGSKYRLTSDQNEKMRYENSRTGYRIATSIGSAATGEGGDRIVFDDPHKAGEIHSDAKRERVIDYWREEMSTRVNDPERSAFVGIMQRLHEGDLAGYILEEGGWDHLCLPGEYEAPRSVRGIEVRPALRNWSQTRLGDPDPRTKEGALLWPARFTRAAMEEWRGTLGSFGYAGQIQQRPSPAEGGIFKRQNWRFWAPKGFDLPPVSIKLPDGTHLSVPVERLPLHLAFELQSWDMTFKNTTEAAFVVGQHWGSYGANAYLLDQVRQKADFVETLKMLQEFRKTHPEGEVLIEDKANGPAVISTLKEKVGGIVAVDVKADKISRGWAEQPYQESGNIYLPHPAIAPWVWDFIEEAANFPNAMYKDQVDTFTQAHHRIRKKREQMASTTGTYTRVQR